MGEQYWHLLAYYSNDVASDASLVTAGTVTDQAINSVTGGYFLPEDFKLGWAYAGNDAFTQVRLNQPSLREPFLPSIAPFSLTTLPANVPPIVLYGDYGPKLYKNETLGVQWSRGTVAASDAYTLLGITKGKRAIPPGPRIPMRFTAAITIAEGTWALGAMTFADTLPSGKYAVVGMDVFGTNLLAARLAFSGGGYRPGILAQGAQGEWNGAAMPHDYMGLWGTFDNTVQPQLECFGVGAGTSQIGYLHLVPLFPFN